MEHFPLSFPGKMQSTRKSQNIVNYFEKLKPFPPTFMNSKQFVGGFYLYWASCHSCFLYLLTHYLFKVPILLAILYKIYLLNLSIFPTALFSSYNNQALLLSKWNIFLSLSLVRCNQLENHKILLTILKNSNHFLLPLWIQNNLLVVSTCIELVVIPDSFSSSLSSNLLLDMKSKTNLLSMIQQSRKYDKKNVVIS